MQLPPLDFVVLDTETTGFIPKVNRVIEFASVRLEKGEVIDTYEELIAIPTDIPKHVVALTRIRDEDLKGKSTFEEKRDEILGHIGENTIIVGQNVSFDIKMLKGEGIDLSDRPWIDTSMLASLVFPELESYSLGYVSQVLNLNHEPVHRALGDVHATLELLGKCWERLLELTPELQEPLQNIMERAPEGYRTLFAALPSATATETPAWLECKDYTDEVVDQIKAYKGPFTISTPPKGELQLVEAALNPAFLQHILNQCNADTGQTQWIAVKNIHATLRSMDIPIGTRVPQPTSKLLDTKAVVELAQKEQYTNDEATLATKIAWYEPRDHNELPIHGDEKQIWNGKLACTKHSEAYKEQFDDLPGVVLINHWELLTLLSDPEHPGYKALTEDTHMIVDDASMLEDTATNAYGYTLAIDDLRAAAEGDNQLTSFTDLLQIWAEKTRQEQDVMYIQDADLNTPEANSIHEQAVSLMQSYDPSSLTYRQLQNICGFLDPEQLKDRIVFIETRQNGSQYLQSVPDRVGDLLNEHLYSRFPVTLLIPPGSSETLGEIIPAATNTETVELETETESLSVALNTDESLHDILENPPEGKTVILMGSRGRIEDVFIRYIEAMEQQGVTLICQGLSGGMGRMQAEFTAAENKAIWVLTPWMFEGANLPPETVDHLMIDTLPFDHPSHAIIGKRAEHYQNAFMDYSLARVEHRLYRLLRTFCRFRTKQSDVVILDDRIEKKDYGKVIWKFLQGFTGEGETEKVEKVKEVKEKKPKKASKPKKAAKKKVETKKPAKKEKKTSEEQLTLF